MPAVEQQIDVAVPVDAAYDQWTRFEELPRFIEGVDEVQEVDETHLRFVEDLTQAEIAERVGVSQLHVSRLIRRALERLRTVAEHAG